MLRKDLNHIVPEWLLAMVVATVLLLGLAMEAPAQDQPEEAEPAAVATVTSEATLTGLGLELEAARLATAMGDRTSAEALARALSNLDGDRIPDGSDAAVALLWGQIDLELGQYSEAASSFGKARGKTSDHDLQVTAEFLKIEALEAEGQDEEAAKSWLKWMSKNQDHSLAADARLHMAWNRLRSGEVDAATGDLINLEENHPWMTADPRYVLGRATAAYLLDSGTSAFSLPHTTAATFVVYESAAWLFGPYSMTEVRILVLLISLATALLVYALLRRETSAWFALAGGLVFNYNYIHFTKDHPSGEGDDLFDLGLSIIGPVAQDTLTQYDDMWNGADQVHCEDLTLPDGQWQDTCQEVKATDDHVPEVLRAYLPPDGDSDAFSLYRSNEFNEADDFIEASLAASTESIDLITANFSMEIYCIINLVAPGFCTIEDSMPYMDAILEALEDNQTHVRVIMENANSYGLENRVTASILYPELVRLGLDHLVELRFFDGRLHAKSGLIDDSLLIIGSQNYQYSAWGQGSGLGENDMTTTDPDAIAEYKAMFEAKWEESIPVTEAEYGSTSK